MTTKPLQKQSLLSILIATARQHFVKSDIRFKLFISHKINNIILLRFIKRQFIVIHNRLYKKVNDIGYISVPLLLLFYIIQLRKGVI